MKKFLALSSLLVWIFISSGAYARTNYDELRDLLLQANIEEIINRVEKPKSHLKDLSSQSVYVYFIALVVAGNLDQIKQNIHFAYKRGKKTEIDEINKHIKLFSRNYNLEDIELSPSELNTIELIRIFEASENTEDQKTKILELINTLDKPVPYCPTKIDFLLELKDSQASQLAKDLALKLIANKQSVLFPNSMDHYELASAYKALAIDSIAQKNLDAAHRYMQIAKENIYKMRSLWLIEDIKIKRPILKIDYRSTKFGFLIPQWLILLREEYDGFFIN